MTRSRSSIGNVLGGDLRVGDDSTLGDPSADQDAIIRLRVEVLAGAAHLWRTPQLRQILEASVAAMLVLGFYESLTFAVIEALDREPSFFAVLMSVQAAGSIAGGVVTSRLIRRLGEGRTLGVGLLTWAIASLIYTECPPFPQRSPHWRCSASRWPCSPSPWPPRSGSVTRRRGFRVA